MCVVEVVVLNCGFVFLLLDGVVLYVGGVLGLFEVEAFATEMREAETRRVAVFVWVCEFVLSDD